MEELFKNLIATVIKELADRRGVTPSALIGGWLLDSVNLPLVQSEVITPGIVPAKKARRKTAIHAELAKKIPRVNGKFVKKEPPTSEQVSTKRGRPSGAKGKSPKSES